MNKFCTKCGAALGEGAKFCVHCGQPVSGENVMPFQVASVPRNEEHAVLKKSPQEAFSLDKGIEWVKRNYKLVGVVLGICIFLLVLVPSSDVSTVKNGSFTFNQSVKIGPAFEKFFDDPTWDSKEVNGKHFVYFTGKCVDMEDGSEQLCEISFEVYPKSNTFHIARVKMNGNDVTAISNQMLRGIVAGNKTIHYGF